MALDIREGVKEGMRDYFIKNWLFILVIAGFCVSYQFVTKKKLNEIASLKETIGLLEEEKNKIINEKEELELRINSHSDQDWIEMVLMEKLGVVPEGKIKVHFSKQN